MRATKKVASRKQTKRQTRSKAKSKPLQKAKFKKAIEPKITVKLTPSEELTKALKGGELTKVRFPSPVEIYKGKGIITAPSDELVMCICEVILTGAERDAVANSLGIPRHEWHKWWYQGEMDLGNGESHTIFARLVMAVQAAESRDEVTNAQLITLGVKNSENLKWMLTCKNPRKWANREVKAVLHGGLPNAPPIPIQSTVIEREITAEEAPALLTILESIGYTALEATKTKER